MGCEHLGQDGARTRTEIKPMLRRRSNMGQERFYHLVEKAAVSLIGGIIFMQIVARFFCCRERQFLPRDEDQAAFSTAQVIPLWAVVEKRWFGCLA